MEDRHKTLLRTKRPYLTEHLQPILHGVLDRLLGCDVLNDNMKQEIEAEPTPVARVRKLLDILPRRGPHAFNNFTTVLLKMKEFDVVQVLDPELTPSGKGTSPTAQPTSESSPAPYKPTISREETTKPPSKGMPVPVPVQIPVSGTAKPSQPITQPEPQPVPQPQKAEPKIGRQFSREVQQTEQPSEYTEQDLIDWPKKLDLSPSGIKAVTIQECTHNDLKKILSDTQVYYLQSPVKGRAVIVKNITYEDHTNLKQRSTADWDAFRLQDVLKRLRFDVKQYVNQTAEKLMQKLKREREEDHHDAFLLVILSYGGVGTVMCTDGKEVPLRDIINVFTADNCPSLKGKPKLFFIQACSTRFNGATGQEMSEPDEQKKTKSGIQDATDAMKSLSLGSGDAPGDILQSSQDMLVSIATQPDVADSQEKYLSMFILALWTVLYKFSRNHHILELMDKINNLKMESGRPVKLCEVGHSLTQKFYFMPGYVGDNHSSIDPLPSIPPPNDLQ